jgi:hypothetical protein
MAHPNRDLSTLLQCLDLGSSVAGSDTLLEAARIETSAFADLLSDRVDLISKRKRQTYLEAEFPHLWKEIEKFSGGKTDYSTDALQSLLGSRWKATVENLTDIGFFSKRNRKSESVYSIPFLYRHGMNLTQGTA